MGERFVRGIRQDEPFKQGDLLLTFDLNWLRTRLSEVHLAITLVNSQKVLAIDPLTGGETRTKKLVAQQDTLMNIYI
jgi:phosphotransferase system IIA component